MADGDFRGVFVIAVTPFDEAGEIDEASLRAQVDFAIEAGVHGIVTPANASEFYALLDEERQRAGRIVVEQAAGRVPVVLTVNAPSTPALRVLASRAVDTGADGLMLMPPVLRPPHEPELWRYFQAVSQAAANARGGAGIPIIVQNCNKPFGQAMPVSFLAKLVDELPGIAYVKEEADPCTHLMTRVMDAVRDKARLKGVFGGQAGKYLMNEAARGACGTMPACDVPDAHVALWNAIERGEQAEARKLYNRLLPLLTMEALYPSVLYKQVLWRRGVIRHPGTRNPSHAPLDEVDRRELDVLLDEISDLLPVHGPFAKGAKA